MRCTVLYYTVLYCTTFYPIMQCAVLYYTVLYYTTFYVNALHCTVMRCNLIESSATTLTAGSTITLSVYTDGSCSTVSSTKSATIGSCTKDDDNSYFSFTTSGSGSITPATTSSSSSNSLKACFAGSETVTLLSGEVISISEVRVGDRVLAADSARQTVFSEVVYVPHGANADKTVFTHITTTQGRDIKMTHSHILPAGACGSTSPLPDVYASSVTVGDCIMTVSGMQEVSAVETVQGQGLYTIVTKEEYVVVNGIIASPFAYNHMLANCYYNIHRFFYALLPGLSGYPLIGSAYEVRRA
jgi:Hint module